MKLFLAFVCVAYASADRLDNTYLPPSNAPTAGGNGNFLGAPIQSQSNTYLPPTRFNNGPAAPRPQQFNGNNNYMRSRPATFNQAPSPKYGAPSVPSTKYGAPDTKYGAPFNKVADARFDTPPGVISNDFHGNKGYNGNAQAFSGAGQSVDGGASILKFKNDNNGDGSYSFEYETENKIMHQEAGSLRAAGGDEDSIAVQGSYSYTGPDGIVYTVNYVADENGFQAYGDHLPTPPPVPEEILKSLEQNAAEEAAHGNKGYSSGPQNVGYNGNNGYNGNQGSSQGSQQQYNGNQGYSGNQQYQGQQINGNKPQGQSFNSQQGYKY